MAETDLRLLLMTLHYAPTFGGSILYIHNLATYVPPGTITVVAPESDNPTGQQAFDASASYPVLRWPPTYSSVSNPRRHKLDLMIRWMVKLRQLLRRQPYDAMIVSGVYPMGVVGILARFLFGKPFVVFNYGEELSTQRRRARSGRGRLRRWWFGVGMCQASGHIVISEFTAQHVLEYGVPPDKILKIRPPYVLEDFALTETELDSVRAQYNLQGKRLVLCVGRLITRKGQDHLIQAMPQILAAVPEAVLVIVGTGPQEGALRALIEHHHLGEHVIMAGGVEPRALAALYTLCDVFAMPNRTLANGDAEGFGIVFTEASAYGKPVVGGNSGGAPDALVDQQTGFLVDGYDLDEIARRIIQLLQDQALAQRMGQAGREWVQTELSPEQAAARLLAFMSRVIHTED